MRDRTLAMSQWRSIPTRTTNPPVRLNELLAVTIAQQLQHVGTHAGASTTGDGVAHVEALQAVTVLGLAVYLQEVCYAWGVKSENQDALAKPYASRGRCKPQQREPIGSFLLRKSGAAHVATFQQP